MLQKHCNSTHWIFSSLKTKRGLLFSSRTPDHIDSLLAAGYSRHVFMQDCATGSAVFNSTLILYFSFSYSRWYNIVIHSQCYILCVTTSLDDQQSKNKNLFSCTFSTIISFVFHSEILAHTHARTQLSARNVVLS